MDCLFAGAVMWRLLHAALSQSKNKKALSFSRRARQHVVEQNKQFKSERTIDETTNKTMMTMVMGQWFALRHSCG